MTKSNRHKHILMFSCLRAYNNPCRTQLPDFHLYLSSLFSLNCDESLPSISHIPVSAPDYFNLHCKCVFDVCAEEQMGPSACLYLVLSAVCLK